MIAPASVDPMMTAVSSRQLASVRFSMRPMALRVTVLPVRLEVRQLVNGQLLVRVNEWIGRRR